MCLYMCTYNSACDKLHHSKFVECISHIICVSMCMHMLNMHIHRLCSFNQIKVYIYVYFHFVHLACEYIYIYIYICIISFISMKVVCEYLQEPKPLAGQREICTISHNFVRSAGRSQRNHYLDNCIQRVCLVGTYYMGILYMLHGDALLVFN